MSKIFSFLLISIIGAFTVSYVNPDWEVIDKKGSSAFYDIIEDHAGELVAVGYTNYKSFGGKDVLISKYNTKGELILRNSLGLKKTDMALDIMLMPDGEYLVSGYRKYKSANEGIILKLDKQLNTVWYKSYNLESNENKAVKSELFDETTLVTLVNSEIFNFLIFSDLEGEQKKELKLNEVKGEVKDFLVFDRKLFLVGEYLDKAFVACVDSEGSVLWQKQFPQTISSAFHTVLMRSDNKLVALGEVDTDEQKLNGFYFICNLEGEAQFDTPKNYGGFDDDITYTGILDQNEEILTGGESLSYERRAKRTNIFFKSLEKNGEVSNKQATFYKNSTNQNDHVYASLITSSGEIVFAGAMNQFAGGSDATIINYGKLDKFELLSEVSLDQSEILYTNSNGGITNNEVAYLSLDLSANSNSLVPGLSLSIASDNSNVAFQKNIVLSPYALGDGKERLRLPLKALVIDQDQQANLNIVLKAKGKTVAENSLVLELKKPLVSLPSFAESKLSASHYLRNDKVTINAKLTNLGDKSSGPLVVVIEDKNNKKLEEVKLEAVAVSENRDLTFEWDRLKYDEEVSQQITLKLYDAEYNLEDEKELSFTIESEDEYLLRQSDLMAASSSGKVFEAQKSKLELEKAAILKQLESSSSLVQKSEVDRLEEMNAALANKQKELAEKIKLEEEARQKEEQRIAEEKEAFAKAEEERKLKEEERRKAEAAAKLKAEEERKQLEAAKKAAELEQQKLEQERLAKEAELKRQEEERIKAAAEAEALKKAEEERIKLEAKEKAEAEKQRLEAERIKNEEAAKKLADELAREEARKAEEEAKRKAEAEEKLKLEEELKQKEAALKKKAEELKKKEEAERLKAEEEAKKKAEEEERLKEEEAERKRLAEELAKEEARRKELEAEMKEKEALRLKLEEEEKLKQEAEAKAKAEAEAKKLAEEKLRLEAEAKRKAEEEAKRKAEEEDRKRLEAELEAEKQKQLALQKELEQKEAEEKLKLEAELKRKEEELQRKAEELKAKEEAEKKRLEEIAKREAEEEARRLEAEAEKQRLEEEQRLAEEKRLEEEKAKRLLEQEEKKRLEEELRLKEEALKKKAEELKAKEEAEKKRLAELAKKAEEDAAKRKLEDEARKKLEEEMRLEEEKKAELEKLMAEREAEEKRLAEELKKKEEELRLKAEELKKKEEEKQLLAEQEAQRKAAEAKRLEELEAQLKAEQAKRAEEEAARLKEQEEARIKAEEEAKRIAEELAKKEEERLKIEAELKAKEAAEKQRLEEEANRKAEEEARLKAEEEARIAKEEALKEEAELFAAEKQKAISDMEAQAQAEMDAMKQKMAEMEAMLKAQQAQMQAKEDSLQNLLKANEAALTKAEKEFIHAVWTEQFISDRPDDIIISQEPVFKISLIAESNNPLTKTNFKVYVNGRHAEGAKFDRVKLGKGKKNKNRFTYPYANEIPLKVGINKIEVFVENDSGKESTGVLKVQYEPMKPNLYVYSMGIPHEDLRFTTNDAGDFASSFMAGSKKVFANQFDLVMDTKEATEANSIIKEFSILARREKANPQITERDLMVIFISSHGYTEENNLFLKASDFDSYIKHRTSINFKNDILNLLRDIPCKKVILIDACQSGGGLSAVEGQKDGEQTKWSSTMLDFFSARSGTKTIFSCNKEEYSYEDERWKNGAFTEAIIKAISTDGPKVDKDGNKEITIKELYSYLKSEVPALVKAKGSTPTSQNPVFFEDNDVNYPIILLD